MPAHDRAIFVIPCRNESAAIASIASALAPNPVLVIDDGSLDDTSARAEAAGARALRHERSEGKGAALRSGFEWALSNGFTWAVAMDGDGQHAPQDALRLLAMAEGKPRLVIGNRMRNANGMPFVRRWINRWMSARISSLAGAFLPDTQCGLRLVHLETWARLSLQTRHFQYESEMLIAWIRAGQPVEFTPIQVIYRAERSKIRPLRDALRWLGWWQRARRQSFEAPAIAFAQAVKPS